MKNLKKVLKVAYELSNNFDTVPSPDEFDKAREFVNDEIDEEVTDDELNHILGHYMGENNYSLNERIREEFFKSDD